MVLVVVRLHHRNNINQLNNLSMEKYLYEDSYNGIHYWKVNHDISGNPRYVIHFMDLITKEENEKHEILESYEFAHKRALKLGGRKYTAKWFGGGFVFQTYDIKRLINKITELTK